MSSVDKLIDESQPTSESHALLLKEIKTLRNKLAKRDAGWELVESILTSIYDGPSQIKVPTPRRSRKKSREVAVLHLSDTHYGKTTETYNSNVCERRLLAMCHAIQEIVELRRKSAAIDKLIVLGGGDWIEGDNIFAHQSWETDRDIVEQVFKGGPEMYASVLLFLAGVFPDMEVHGVTGNHGRRAQGSPPQFNADSIVYQITKTMVAMAAPEVGKRINWNLPFDRQPDEHWFVRFPIVKGSEGLLVHGHQMRGGFAGFPWYAFGKKIGGWNSVDRMAGFDYVFAGHFHTETRFDLNKVTVMSSGSTESDNPYALENMASAGDAKQRLCFFNEKYGLLGDHPLHLGHIE